MAVVSQKVGGEGFVKGIGAWSYQACDVLAREQHRRPFGGHEANNVHVWSTPSCMPTMHACVVSAARDPHVLI
jgi:hypothetical protein